MRPLELEMTAFGSYAETVTVPFEELRQGLYLVAGDTGAGKTTIFDGVVFALYGRASGRDRSPAMLHSDYVPKSTDTVVRLRFEENGKEYTVHRSIHFPRKKGTEDSYGDQQISALLEEPDREPVEGAEKVTRRIEELLGLNAEQFRKIVMLAQGEFREFLKADSDKKNEILGKLFDNSQYLRFQNLLSGARDALAERRSARQEELRLLMQNVFLPPEEMKSTAAEGFLPGHPGLLDNLLALTETEQAQLKERNAQQERLRQRISELDGQKGAAMELNANFAALEKLERELAALQECREDMLARKLRLERAETAFYQVRPVLENRERAETALKVAREALRLQTLETERREQDLELALIQARDDEKMQARLGELERLLQQTEDQLRRLRELEKTQRELAALLREKETAEAEEESLAKRCTETENLLETLRLRLDELEGTEALVLQRQSSCEQSRERKEKLEELRKSVEALQKDKIHLHQQEERLSLLAKAALEAEGEYHRLYHAFLKDQAGLMARELRREIDIKGTARCPVCGSVVGQSEASAFARDGADLPDQAAVDAAKTRLERAEKARSEQDKLREALAAQIRSRLETTLDTAGRMIPDCGCWEDLCDGRLEQSIQQQSEHAAEAERSLLEARQLEQERQNLRQRKPTLEQAQRKNSDAREKLRVKLQELRSGEERLRALKQERETGLLYHSEAEAENAKKDLLREQGQIQTALEQSKKRIEQARSLRDTAQGSLQEKKQLAEDREAEDRLAEENLNAAFEAADFPDAAGVRAALAPAGEKDPAAWLREERKIVSDWEAELLHKGQQFRQQRESLQGKEPTDLTQLEEQLKAENEALSRCAEERSKAEGMLNNHLMVLKRVKEAQDALSESDRSWKRLERLGSLAVGMNSEGGKLSFDRYAMGSVFREILEMANRRMDTMSGGRYQLVHRSAADRRNAKAGLEIQVLDMTTGQLRGSESLSGGEGFFTSLSLALGLADVVQNRSGGRNLDAIFIDEGFGSLSGGVLDKALEVLGRLTEGQRLVGIISHVEQLEESIPQKIRVESSERGSRLRIERG